MYHFKSDMSVRVTKNSFCPFPQVLEYLVDTMTEVIERVNEAGTFGYHVTNRKIHS